MAEAEKDAQSSKGLSAVGHNVILTKMDGTPTLVNLFRMISADQLEDRTIITVDDPKAIAGAATGTGSTYHSATTKFQTVDCTKDIPVQETLEQILQKQAESMKLGLG